MSPANKQIRVVALCDPGATQQQITEALNIENEFSLVDILASKEMLARQLRAAEPDILLVDSQLGNESTMDIIDDLALQFPTAAIVAILPTNDPLVAQQVMLAGARAFLITPFSQINLISTLRRVTELEGRGFNPRLIFRPSCPKPPAHCARSHFTAHVEIPESHRSPRIPLSPWQKKLARRCFYLKEKCFLAIWK